MIFATLHRALLASLIIVICPISQEQAQSQTNVSVLEQRLMQLEGELVSLRKELGVTKGDSSAPAIGAPTVSFSEANYDANSPASSASATPIPCQCDASHPASKYPTVKVSGFFHFDTVWFGQDPVNRQTVGDLQDGSDFRRSRLGVSGNLSESVTYMMEYDFAESQARFTDVWATFNQVPAFGAVRVGRWRQPFGMTEMTSVRDLPFLERPLPFCMSPFRQSGIGFFGLNDDETITWAASVFRYPTDNFGGNVGDNGGYGVASRITMLPWYIDDGEQLLHIGLNYWGADPSRDESRFFATPEIQVVDSLGSFLPAPAAGVPPFVDTGVVPTDFVSTVGIEAAAAIGRLYLQSEFRWMRIDQIGGPAQNIEGCYAEARYVLTGEQLPYNTKNGVFGRIVPFEDAGCGGIGAWEIAARWSYLDFNGDWLSPAQGPGRRLNDATLGLNWYVNRNAKFQLNYIHAMLSDLTLGDSTADIYAVRCQIDF